MDVHHEGEVPPLCSLLRWHESFLPIFLANPHTSRSVWQLQQHCKQESKSVERSKKIELENEPPREKRCFLTSLCMGSLLKRSKKSAGMAWRCSSSPAPVHSREDTARRKSELTGVTFHRSSKQCSRGGMRSISSPWASSLPGSQDIHDKPKYPRGICIAAFNNQT